MYFYHALLYSGVFAYVEVRSQFANVSRAIAQQLWKLGATISPKLTNEVTHVVFKDGKKSTFDKAKKKGVYLVSVSWVERLVTNMTKTVFLFCGQQIIINHL